MRTKSKDTTVKMEESGSEGQFNLEGILSELGSFGKYQLLLLFLLAFRDSFLNMCNFNYVFTALDVSHRCQVPECEITPDHFNPTWTSFALRNNTNTCLRPVPFDLMFSDSNSTFIKGKVSSIRNVWSNVSCTPGNFDADRTVPCDKIVYENYNSIIAEFDLGCHPWKKSLIGTIHNLGLVFSFIISGIISDRYGRKVVIVVTPLVVGIMGLIKSFSVNYWMLLVFEFMETALGYGNASMVLSLEMVSQNRRVIFSCISDILASFGGAFFGLIAWKIPYWRYMMRAIYTPLLVVVFYIFLVDEGVRWLLAHNKKDEAVRVLNKVAKVNNVTLSDKAKRMLVKISEERNKIGQTDQNKIPVTQQKLHLLSVLRSKKMLLRMALIAACFICCTFVYTGTIIKSASVTGNKYLNYSAMFLLFIPSRIITAFTLTRFGRKVPICVAYTLCSVFFIASSFVPTSVSWASNVLYLLGNMCSSYGMFSMFVLAMEVFPTTTRNSLTNIAQTVGRIGSVVAPQVPLLDHCMTGLSIIVFGLVSLGPAVLALFLPETGKAALPEHVADAEKLDNVDNDVSVEEQHTQTIISSQQKESL